MAGARNGVGVATDKEVELVQRTGQRPAVSRRQRRRGVEEADWRGHGFGPRLRPVSKAERIGHLRVANEDGLDPHYAGWFDCFNRGQYYEAHDVLEALWLGQRGRANDLFYKGLIQLAGAFVHLQKNRLRPADALFRLAEGNLRRYAPRHERLDLDGVLVLIADWRGALDGSGFSVNPLPLRPAPRIEPEPSAPIQSTR